MTLMNYWTYHRPTDSREYPEYRADQVISSGLIPKDAVLHPDKYYPDIAEYNGKRAAEVLGKIQGHPDALVRVFRGAPSNGVLNTGDWVTFSKEYAALYAGNGPHSDNPDSAIFSYLVKASDLSFDGDSIYEYGYWGEAKGISGKELSA